MTQEHPQGVFPVGASVGHQAETVSIRGLFKWAVVLFVGTLLTCAVVAAQFVYYQRRAAAWDRKENLSPMRPLRGTPPDPLLQWSPGLDLAVMKAHQGEWLHSGGVFEGHPQAAHLPIEDAMKRVAAGEGPRATGFEPPIPRISPPRDSGTPVGVAGAPTGERQPLPTGVQVQPTAPPPSGRQDERGRAH